MKCESAHKIVQVWREFDRKADIQYRIDGDNNYVYLRIHYLGNLFIYECKEQSVNLYANGKYYINKSIHGALTETMSRFSGGTMGRFYNAINTVPMQKQPIKRTSTIQNSPKTQRLITITTKRRDPNPPVPRISR